MMIKTPHLFLLLSALSGGLLSASLCAQSITVNITGQLNQPACTPSLSTQLLPGTGISGNTVSLPEVLNNVFTSSNRNAGYRQVVFRASGCTGSSVNNMWVHFTGSSVDSNGRIVPGGGSNVDQMRFEIRNNSASGALVRVGGTAGSTPNANQGTAASFSGSHPANSNRIADKTYYIGYYAETLPVTYAGQLSATITANFKYY